MSATPTPTPTPAPTAGQFVWNEFTTHDRSAAARFYQQLFGWTLGHYALGGQESSLFRIGERDVAGLVDNPDPQGKPFWLSYVRVDNLEVTCARVAELGAQVVLPITVVPNVGRIAVLQDPQGAYLGLFQA